MRHTLRKREKKPKRKQEEAKHSSTGKVLTPANIIFVKW